MATVKDVARLAGVSTATVSRTLSNPDKVQEATRIKVISAAKKLGYSPNAMARSLRRQESKTILVILPDIANAFFSEIVQGIEDIAHREGYKILLGDAGNSASRAMSYVDLYDSKQVDGIILLTAEVSREVFENKFLQSQMPVIMACEYFPGSPIPVININNQESAQHAVAYLLSLGHTQIATITGPSNSPITVDRNIGYERALAAQNIPINEHFSVGGDYSFQSGKDAGRVLLQLTNPPTAIFCHNDEMAIGVLNIARELNLNVPNDLSVIGFDDIPFSEYCEPALTTVHQPRELIGQNAMKALLDRLHEKHGKKGILSQSLPTQFIVRKSASRPNH